MQCFNHVNEAAVGSCKICMKGLCPACAVDLGHSLACKGPHEVMANDTHALIMRNMKVQSVAGKSRFIAPAFFGAMGLIFLVDGLRSSEGIESFGTLMGGGFLVFATVALVMNVRAYGQAGDDND